MQEIVVGQYEAIIYPRFRIKEKFQFLEEKTYTI